MTYYEEKKEVLKNLKKSIKKIDGYKVYDTKSSDGKWFCVVTPRSNVLYFQNGEFFGFSASLQYIPSQNTGSGCSCSDEPFYEITPEKLIELENKGLLFAKKLHAKFYKSPEDFFKNAYFHYEEF